MERRELEQFLHEYITLSKAMGIQVEKSNAEHVFHPKQPILNHSPALAVPGETRKH